MYIQRSKLMLSHVLENVYWPLGKLDKICTRMCEYATYSLAICLILHSACCVQYITVEYLNAGYWVSLWTQLLLWISFIFSCRLDTVGMLHTEYVVWWIIWKGTYQVICWIRCLYLTLQYAGFNAPNWVVCWILWYASYLVISWTLWVLFQLR